jgi:ubiquitin C-terminal hydrolase
MYLSLPLPEEKSKKGTSLNDCLDEFLKEEKLEKEEKWYFSTF